MNVTLFRRTKNVSLVLAAVIISFGVFWHFGQQWIQEQRAADIAAARAHGQKIGQATQETLLRHIRAIAHMLRGPEHDLPAHMLLPGPRQQQGGEAIIFGQRPPPDGALITPFAVMGAGRVSPFNPPPQQKARPAPDNLKYIKPALATLGLVQVSFLMETDGQPEIVGGLHDNDRALALARQMFEKYPAGSESGTILAFFKSQGTVTDYYFVFDASQGPGYGVFVPLAHYNELVKQWAAPTISKVVFLQVPKTAQKKRAGGGCSRVGCVVYEEYLVSLSTLMRLYMPHDQIIQRDTHLAYFFSSALPTMMVMLVLVGAWAMSHIYRLRRNRYRLHQNVVAKNKQLDSTLQLQQKQKLHLEILLQAIEQGATMIVLLCEKHRIEYCNASYFRSAEACLGAFDQCAHGSSNAIDFLDTLVEAEDRTMLADVFQNLAAGGVWQGEYARKGIGDQKVFVMAAVSAVENPETGLCKYVVVEEDITVKMETERYLRVAKEDADQANRAKSEFLSSVSHELRTPLNAVIGFAQFLDLDLHNNLTTQQKEYIGHIQESGEYLLTLIEGVLDLAQIEAGKMSVSLERVDIVQTIRDVVVVIQAFADSRDVSVQLDRVPAAPLYIMADNIRIKQALLNLLNNAIKYNKVGGLVDVRVDDKQSSVRIAISDTGYGIPKGRIGELFERFNRLGRTSADADGTGIGLAITKELVHAMGGTIGCYSREDEGATFWIRMPAIKTHIDYPKQPIDAARKPSAPKGDTTENGRVFDTDAVLCPIKDVDVTRLLAHKTIVCFGNGAHFTTQMGDMFGDIQGGKFVKVRSTQVDHLELKSYAPDLVLLHIGTEHHVRQAQRVLAQDGVASLLFIILCDHHMIAALHDVLQETPRTVVVFETPNSVDNFIKVLKCALERAQNTPLHLGHAPRTPAADEHAED